MTEHFEPREPFWGKTVSPSRGRASVGEMVAGALLLVFGLSLAGFLAFNLADQVPFWLGRAATAEVVDLRHELVGEDSQGQQVYDYYVQYRFAMPDGQIITRTEPVAVQEWDRVGIGGQIDVLYSPLHPDKVRVDYRRMMLISVSCSLPIAIVAWVSLLSGWRLFRRGLGKSED